MTRPLAAILAAFLFVRPVAAETVCGPLDVAIEAFRVRHGEVPYATMRDHAGRRLVVLANPETRSWSMLVLSQAPETVACLVSAGHDIAPMERVPGRRS